MSVTFTSEYVAEASFGVSCSCGEAESATVFPNHEAAYAAAIVEKTVVMPFCSDALCNLYPVRFFMVTDVPEVSLNPANARTVMDVLGMEVDETGDNCGSMNAEDFLGRILLASAINPSDEGTMAFGDEKMTFGSRPVGYMEARLNDLRTVADYAIAKNLEVVWS